MRVAFVVSFYGAAAGGGAEAECRQTVLRLARSGMDVDVWTTCSLDLTHNWHTNHYSEGIATEDGIRIHRYPVAPIHMVEFSDLNTRIIDGYPLSRTDEERFMAMHVSSPALVQGLAGACDQYRWICFIPYPFGITYYATQVCAERSILIACLHNEGYAKLSITRELFRRVRKVVFHTGSEMALARDLYGLQEDKCLLIGEGVETRFESSAERFRQKYGIAEPFVLYAGRKDPTKNVDMLIRYFAAYKKARGGAMKLVLVGPASLPIPPDMQGQILDLGFVSDQDKKDAYSAATVFCQPSVNESFSIVMMESWACGVPCLVHARCAVTREHVAQSGGGLYFDNAAEFAGCLDYWNEHPETAHRMGAAGRGYARDKFEWDLVIRRYREEVFEL